MKTPADTAPKLASLPMYDFPAVRGSTRALWGLIRENSAPHFSAVPSALSAVEDVWQHWMARDLFFSQTCGFPFVQKLRGQVNLIGTPDYGIVDGKPGWYFSAVLCRQNDRRIQLSDFHGATFALNETGSQSGCQAMMSLLHQEFGPEKLFAGCLETGAHAASAQAVLEGQADICAVDAVTWLHLQRDDPRMAGLRVLLTTDPSPGLPYVSARFEGAEGLPDILDRAITGLGEDDREGLFLRGFWRSQDVDYDIVKQRARAASGVFSAYFPDDESS